MKHSVLLFNLFLLTGCGIQSFPLYTVLGDLRILTVIPSASEVNPGTAVTFTPVLSDLNGSGRTLNYSVQACADPGVGIGATPQCSSPDASSIQTGTVMLAAGSSQTYTGPVTTFSLSVPSTLLDNQNTISQYNGVSYLVFYTVSVPNSSTSVTAFVRVTVSSSTKTTKNQNPTITSIDLNDSAVSSPFTLPTSSVNFRVTSPTSATETYSYMNLDGSLTSKTEQLINTWFVSDGSFASQRTASNSENSWSPPSSKPSGRGVVMVIVTRDGRNGATFQKIEMN